MTAATLSRPTLAPPAPNGQVFARSGPSVRRQVAAPMPAEAKVRAWGTSSVSPFTLGPDRAVLGLTHGGLVGVIPEHRWAVMATDPISPPGMESHTLDDALGVLDDRRLRPMFAAVVDDLPYRERGLWTEPMADDALIDLGGFTLAGKPMASIRHSVGSARRAGITVVPWSSRLTDGATEVSSSWLATKRGGEMGFTLGRFDPAGMADVDCRVALDAAGTVVGLVTWHTYRNGRARVLDIMRRSPDAPNPTMDLLIAESLLEFAAAGIETASLGCVPRSCGTLAERIYPTRSLHRYKDKFAPVWEPRHMVVPARRHVPFAMATLARAYSPDGLVAAFRRNR